MAPPTLTSRTDAALLLGWTAPALYASPLITYEVEVDNGTAAIFPFAKLAYTGEPHSLHRYRSTAADELNAVRYASASPPGEKTI